MRSGFGKTSSHSYPPRSSFLFPNMTGLCTHQLVWTGLPMPERLVPSRLHAVCGDSRPPSPLARSRHVTAPRYPCGQASSFTGHRRVRTTSPAVCSLFLLLPLPSFVLRLPRSTWLPRLELAWLPSAATYRQRAKPFDFGIWHNDETTKSYQRFCRFRCEG